MRMGDKVTDSKGRSWAVQALLGRGLWAKVYLVETSTGTRAVLKCPLEKSDFKDKGVALADACQQAAAEQSRLLSGGSQPYLPPLFDTLELDSGRTALLMPHLGQSLEKILVSQPKMDTVLQILCKVAAMLTEAKPILHGNLRPSNIFLNENGNVVLTDVMTVGLHEARKDLENAHGQRQDFTPPEAEQGPTADWDPWAMCLMTYCAVSASEEARKDAHAQGKQGLKKAAITVLKDNVLSRLKAEEANPRFLGRAAEEISKLLNRGLSEDAAPSPPYRFLTTSELYPRLRSISDLVHPTVEAVGHVLLSSVARDGVFKDGAPPAFSVTVACSSGTTHDDVATGIRVKDLDAQGDSRVAIPGAQYTVKAHPSGRLRFDFTLPALHPGRFQVKVAFTVKDSGKAPMLSEGKFEVRPPPGYVPPREEDPSVRAPLQFPSSKAPSSRPMEPDPELDPPSDASDAGMFPEPLAPSSPGTDPGTLVPLEPIPTDPQPTSPPVPRPDAFVEPDTLPTPVEPSRPNISEPIPIQANPEFSPDWEALPTPIPPPPKDGFAPTQPAPEGYEDLPTWNNEVQSGESKFDFEATVNRLTAYLWQNTLVAFAAILGLLLAFLALAGFFMNSCSG